MKALDSILYPQLRSFPIEERATALESARRNSFDVVELVGIALGVILATAITRYQIGPLTALERLGAVLLNFLIAIPLLVVLVGPFLVRRVRRGLDRQLAKRSRP